MPPRRIRSQSLDAGAGNTRNQGKASIKRVHVGEKLGRDQLAAGILSEGKYDPRSVHLDALGHDVLARLGGTVIGVTVGEAVISDLDTSVVVPHELSDTPASGALQVTPLNDMATSAKFWVESVNSTTFTIAVDAAPGSGSSARFGYQIHDITTAGPVIEEPTDVSGLAFWVMADTLALSDTDPVSTWADQSGNGMDLIQPTAGNQPLYRTNQLNGMPVIRGDGVDDEMSTGTNMPTTNTSDWMMWGVFNNRSTGTARQGPVYIGNGSTNGYGIAVRANTGNKGALFGGVAWLDSTEAESTGWDIYVLQRRGSSTTRLWVNGGSAMLNSASAPVTPTNRLYAFRIPNNAIADVDIAEMGLHAGATYTADHANTIGEYLADRWGLSWSTATD